MCVPKLTLEDPLGSAANVCSDSHFSFFAVCKLLAVRADDPDVAVRCCFSHRALLDLSTESSERQTAGEPSSPKTNLLALEIADEDDL